MERTICPKCGSKLKKRNPYIEKKLNYGNVLIDCEYQYCPSCGYEEVTPLMEMKIKETLQKEIDNHLLIIYTEDGIRFFLTLEQLCRKYKIPCDFFEKSKNFLDNVYHSELDGKLLFLKSSVERYFSGKNGHNRLKSYGTFYNKKCLACGTKQATRKGWILQDEFTGNVIVDDVYIYCSHCGFEKVKESTKQKAFEIRQKRIEGFLLENINPNDNPNEYSYLNSICEEIGMDAEKFLNDKNFEFRTYHIGDGSNKIYLKKTVLDYLNTGEGRFRIT